MGARPAGEKPAKFVAFGLALADKTGRIVWTESKIATRRPITNTSPSYPTQKQVFGRAQIANCLKSNLTNREGRNMRVRFRCDPSLIDLLPQPQLARETLPDWLRAMPAVSHSQFHGKAIRTVKQCPPFVEAMRLGFVILLPCDVEVVQGRFSWNWEIPQLTTAQHPRAPLAFHAPAQLEGAPFATPGQSAIKFNGFWTIELEPGWSLFVTHPINREELPFRTLTGWVHADLFHAAGINFPALWTQPDFKGVLRKGTPVAQCFPVLRDDLILDCEAFDADAGERFTRIVGEVQASPGVYRKRFRPRRARS
jgi:hypothetical protein